MYFIIGFCQGKKFSNVDKVASDKELDKILDVAGSN